ncbi:MAG: hypothetical protein JO016_13160 [Actinobacteria bacterium]|nr:hypothetical protein [Actinomycetota bacterium]
MNDHDLLTTVRESFTEVQSATPVEQIVRRGHAIGVRRRIPAGVAVAAVAAAAGTAAAIISSGPAKPAPVAAQTTAYVVSQVARALDAMPGNTVVFTQRLTVPASDPVIDTWEAPGAGSRQDNLTLAGQPESASSISLSGPAARLTRTVTVVDYRTRTWWRSASSYGPGNVPATVWNCSNVGTDDLNWNPSEMAAQLKTELSCGDLKVVGRGPVGGVPAVRLSGYFNGSGTLTYWVNAATYLPFRFTAAGSGPALQVNLQWLPPTAANLAEMNVPIPAGFTRVPPPGTAPSP